MSQNNPGQEDCTQEEHRAWCAFVDGHQNDVYEYAFSRLRNSYLARNATSAAFQELHERQNDLVMTPSVALIGIAKRKVERSLPAAIHGRPETTPNKRWLVTRDKEISLLERKVLLGLPPRHASLLSQRDLVGKPLAQMADELKIDEFELFDRLCRSRSIFSINLDSLQRTIEALKESIEDSSNDEPPTT